MERVDALIVGLVVVAVVGSAIGIVTYDEDRKPVDFALTWAQSDTTIESDAVRHTSSGEMTIQVPVALRNMTTVDGTVTIAAGGPRFQSSQVRVTVTVPGLGPFTATGDLGAGPATTIQIPISFDINVVPTDDTVRASSPDTARARLDQRFGSDVGVGAWTVQIQFGAAGPGPLDSEDHDASVTFDIQTYDVQITPPVPDINR